MDMQYVYTAGANNGRIAQTIDGVANETVSYTYDALNRLSGAGATNGSWGQAYTYDGFGNLTGKAVTAGSAPVLNVSVDPATNRVVGQTYDANGNAGGGWGTHDVENRMIVGADGGTYVYDQGGKRVKKSNGTTWEYYFYGIGGQKLVTQACTSDGCLTAPQYNVYFGGKLVKSKGVLVATDRLGSVRASGIDRMSYYPYGEERTSTADGGEKFGTYTRDSATQDYADQRYYAVGMGRFGTADPYRASGGPEDPGSWNRYTYVQGDPIDLFDPRGTNAMNPLYCDASETRCTSSVSSPDGPGDWGSGGGVGNSPCDGWGIGFGIMFAQSPDPACYAPVVYGEDEDDTEEEAWRCPANYQNWINAHGADAVATGLSEANVLAASAIESGWGGGRFAKEGNSFFNLETLWTPGTRKPAPKYAYQVSWIQAKEMFTSGPNKGKYSLVASYKNASDSFRSFTATLGKYLNGVADAATFASRLVAHGINAGRDGNFANTVQTFQDCLNAQ
jgi:RHS repeat-associated protein